MLPVKGCRSPGSPTAGDLMSANRDDNDHDARRQALTEERAQLLQRLDDWLDVPMVVLAFVWLALLVVELVQGTSALFETLGLGIWVIFIINFTLEFTLAPHKLAYLRTNWLTALSLLVPALRILRVVRVLRVFRLAPATRGLRLLRVVSSLNRGMGALAVSLQRRGFPYVAALTLLVTFAGAAGMYAFENDVPNGIHSYGESLWWTAMIMTTLGSQYWPQTLEGRILCVVLALYAFGVFGYVTATLATFFVGRDADSAEAGIVGVRSIAALQSEITALREEIRLVSRKLHGE
jgi:voltage-gated potassium channel